MAQCQLRNQGIHIFPLGLLLLLSPEMVGVSGWVPGGSNHLLRKWARNPRVPSQNFVPPLFGSNCVVDSTGLQVLPTGPGPIGRANSAGTKLKCRTVRKTHAKNHLPARCMVMCLNHCQHLGLIMEEEINRIGNTIGSLI